MVFINEMRHGLWVQLRRRSELQQVVRVVEFLPQVPQHLFFCLGMQSQTLVRVQVEPEQRRRCCALILIDGSKHQVYAILQDTVYTQLLAKHDKFL